MFGRTLKTLLVQKPDLVISDHAHLSPLAWLARRFIRFRMVSLVYFAELIGLGYLRKMSLRNSDRIIAISEFTEEQARKVLGDLAPLRVCPLGLSPDYEVSALHQHLENSMFSDRRVILIIGRMADQIRDKGHEALIRAMPEVARQVPEALLVIVGQGADETRLRKLVATLGVGRHVHFSGYVPDSQLSSYYRASEMFAMPSNSEGFGLVYLEAMFHGKPCIAGNRDAAREVVVDGKTGLLVSPGNVPQLQAAILRLLQDRQLSVQLGQAGRARLEENFTYQRFADRISPLLWPTGKLATSESLTDPCD